MLQAQDQSHKLQLHIQKLKDQSSNDWPAQDLLPLKRESAALRVWSPEPGHDNSTNTKRMARSRGSEGRGEARSKSRVDFALCAKQSPLSGDPSGNNSMLLASPPTPLYTSTGLSLQHPQHVRHSASPAPNTGNTIFYATASPAVGKSEMYTRANSSTRHSRLSADPTVPSLTLPEEMKDNPDGISKAGRLSQVCRTFSELARACLFLFAKSLPHPMKLFARLMCVCCTIESPARIDFGVYLQSASILVAAARESYWSVSSISLFLFRWLHKFSVTYVQLPARVTRGWGQ